MRKFHVVLIPDEDGGYYVEVIGLPGCVTQGDTIEECLKNAKEAIELHLEGLQDDRPDVNPIFATVEVD
ncbi:type II toxin-antitoxin system HicB family antitoxin [Caldalkalibacillus thermarum]|uniref:type II toxin-antitoxin system HicB family antitoxin n=1 Tax=Caldalkalibacillus thermarum TaxID=296745 RepID=UPI001FD21C55|nr:type II toxin-antitoxin system HicB family antitoxin [Caldalkalibacillus thermarum]